jgi:hypothetical protein
MVEGHDNGIAGNAGFQCSTFREQLQKMFGLLQNPGNLKIAETISRCLCHQPCVSPVACKGHRERIALVQVRRRKIGDYRDPAALTGAIDPYQPDIALGNGIGDECLFLVRIPAPGGLIRRNIRTLRGSNSERHGGKTKEGSHSRLQTRRYPNSMTSRFEGRRCARSHEPHTRLMQPGQPLSACSTLPPGRPRGSRPMRRSTSLMASRVLEPILPSTSPMS